MHINVVERVADRVAQVVKEGERKAEGESAGGMVEGRGGAG